MADEPLRHTKSKALKWVVRRRNRQRKPSANSSERIVVDVWHGRSQFTPSGAGSVRWLGIGVVGLLAVPLVMYAGGILFIIGMIIVSPEITLMEKLIWGPFSVIMFTAPLWGTALVMLIYARLDGNTKASRARLIAAADRLREQRDAEANRGT